MLELGRQFSEKDFCQILKRPLYGRVKTNRKKAVAAGSFLAEAMTVPLRGEKLWLDGAQQGRSGGCP
jgi:hypothetical protein